MIERIQLLRNIGTFDSVDSGAQLPLNKFSLIYAENSRGKTTMAAVFRSLSNGNPVPIMERKRLGSANSPHVVISCDDGQTAVFQNSVWTNSVADIGVFDDHFISENVCSGIEVETEHRQNLHVLIIGAQGVALHTELQGQIDAIEQHNRDLQTKDNAIPIEARGGLSVEAFCAIENRQDIDDAIQNAERNLAASRDADAVRQQDHFVPISLPTFDLATVESLLNLGLPDLEAEAAAQIQSHLAKIGDGGETWVGEGMNRVESASSDRDNEVCPFCAQDLSGSPLIKHYQAYFSAAYLNLKQSIADNIQELNTAHSGEIQAAFERAVRVAIQTQQFWTKYTDIPDVEVDTAAISLAWKQAYEAVSSILCSKQNSPLEKIELNTEIKEHAAAYHALRDEVVALNNSLMATRPKIDIVKEKAAIADIATLESDLNKFKVIKARYSLDIVPLCNDYLQEKERKAVTEKRRDSARKALNQYRDQVFPAYEAATNTYLQRFNAGFRLDSVSSVNLRSGSTLSYNVLINQVAVPLSAGAEGEPSFRNTLGAGDRNTLALAFFFACLENEPNKNQKIILFDDPMTSLDEHQSLTTIQELRSLSNDVAQVIVLSHSKSFLCNLWLGVDRALRSACKIVRASTGSTIDDWDVNQDSITEHDKRHEKVRNYIQNSVGADERTVATALRPILESFIRVAYPQWFPPGTLLGAFINLCQQREGETDQILSSSNRAELEALIEYANKFHHDTNPAWQTVIINDQELLTFANRTLTFTCR